jgi:poly(3-hydroxybutyrate) depolymerase
MKPQGLNRVMTGSRCWWWMVCASMVLAPAWAQTAEEPGSRWQRLRQVQEAQRENRQATVSQESLGAVTANIREDRFGDRDMLVYVPSVLPPPGQRALLVALHGGGGNARFMLEHLKINGLAEKHGFIVAYLNGSAAARVGGQRLKAWNAGGGCCGKPYEDKVDDIAYITGAVEHLQRTYAIAPGRSFGVGHSNGAMMLQTMACVSHVFSHVASLAGALMAEVPSCPTAHRHTIRNYHGEFDENVPLAGGFGTKGVTRISYPSQEVSRARFEASGGQYLLQVLPGAGHSIEQLSQSSQQHLGLTLAERVARDLGLASP